MRGLVKPLIPLNAAKVRKNGDSTKIFVPFLVFLMISVDLTQIFGVIVVFSQMKIN